MNDEELKTRLGDIKADVQFFGWCILAVLEKNFGNPWWALALFTLAVISLIVRIEFRRDFWSKVWNR